MLRMNWQKRLDWRRLELGKLIHIDNKKAA